MTRNAMSLPDMGRLAKVQEQTAGVRAVMARMRGDTDDNKDVRRQGLTESTLRRCRAARTRGAISGAWSTGEQLLVALVLNSADHLAAMDYTAQQAHEHVYGDLPVAMSPGEYVSWLNELRLELA